MIPEPWLVIVPSWPHADARSVTSGTSQALHYSSYSNSFLHISEKELFYLPTINMVIMPQISGETPQKLAKTNLKDLLFWMRPHTAIFCGSSKENFELKKAWVQHFTIANIVIGRSLHIHSFLHLSVPEHGGKSWGYGCLIVWYCSIKNICLGISLFLTCYLEISIMVIKGQVHQIPSCS